MAPRAVQKKRKKKRADVEAWRIRSARRQAQYGRRIKRDADQFKRLISRWRQEIVDSPEIPKAEKCRLSQLSDSEFAIYLAEQHQKEKLKKPTRRDPHENKPWLPGYNSL